MSVIADPARGRSPGGVSGRRLLSSRAVIAPHTELYLALGRALPLYSSTHLRGSAVRRLVFLTSRTDVGRIQPLMCLVAGVYQVYPLWFVYNYVATIGAYLSERGGKLGLNSDLGCSASPWRPSPADQRERAAPSVPQRPARPPRRCEGWRAPLRVAAGPEGAGRSCAPRSPSRTQP